MVGAIELGRSNWEAVSDGDNWWDTGGPSPGPGALSNNRQWWGNWLKLLLFCSH